MLDVLCERHARIVFRLIQLFVDQGDGGDATLTVLERGAPALVIHLTELIRAALLGQTAGANHPEFQAHNYYLRHGIGETVEFFKSQCEQSGVRFLYNTTPTVVQVDEQRATSVSVKTVDGDFPSMPSAGMSG